MKSAKILTIIPCYNADRHISHVINNLKKYVSDILVIDDGSTDNSLSEMKKVKGVKIISHKKNMGKGAALKTGFVYALKKNYDAVITIDADDQHKPYDIPNFLKNYNKADIIVGSRLWNARNMPLRRLLGNSISSFMVSLMCKQKVSDSQSGYRLIKASVLRNINLSYNDYLLETEIFVKAARKNYKIKSIPIETIYGEEVSHINPFKLTYKFIKFVLKNFK